MNGLIVFANILGVLGCIVTFGGGIYMRMDDNKRKKKKALEQMSVHGRLPDSDENIIQRNE
ncbi:MAG: hypothetical protein JO154_08720 [Chitinophaga sp.]|uniref:hypothetical protein n=1 Tax=Chitinophaga sp. TaxID=1869181 RepID=UPI0025C431A6|nr:hypothetical protein [Chitinophaga sp.]MBV8252677.1 hypothetical protein [Chitinophaga sp.]